MVVNQTCRLCLEVIVVILDTFLTAQNSEMVVVVEVERVLDGICYRVAVAKCRALASYTTMR